MGHVRYLIFVMGFFFYIQGSLGNGLKIIFNFILLITVIRNNSKETAPLSIFRSAYSSYDATDVFSTNHMIMSLSRHIKVFGVAECALHCFNNSDCYSFSFIKSNFDSINCKLFNETPLMSSDLHFSISSSIFLSNIPRSWGYNCLSDECDQSKGLNCQNNKCACSSTNK